MSATVFSAKTDDAPQTSQKDLDGDVLNSGTAVPIENHFANAVSASGNYVHLNSHNAKLET